ncbi:MAG: DUF1801 domain-containing protein [Spirochaetes bacterium]|nr:DUF1801 domain-containing protein [Spirochaetota bacterium]
MQSKATTPDAYIAELPADRQAAMTELRKTIRKNLPTGFEETMSYGMIGYVVPLKTYPDGYHCNPELPLPFMNLASQKNFIAFYHMGIYAMPDLLKWFKTEWPRHTKAKLDMGKSCIRFKKAEDIPLKLIGNLVKKISMKNWVETYEKNLKKK